MRQVHLLAGMGLMAATLAGGATLASAAPDEAGKCTVTVDRSQAADSYQVNRQVLDNGDCVCYVYTGPDTQSAAVEQRIADLQQRRECLDRPAAAIPPGETAAAGGGFDTTVAAIAAVAAAGGGIAAAVSGGDDSPGG